MPLKAVMPTDLRAPAPLPATEHTADGRNHVEAEDDRRRVGLKLDQKALDRKLRRVFSGKIGKAAHRRVCRVDFIGRLA